MKEIHLEIYNKIKEYNTIIIHRHIRADGDAIGSQVGLKYALLENFPDKHIYAVGDKVPEYLSKVAENDEISDDTYKGALAITVDTSNEDRVSDDRFKLADYVIKIDHHNDSPDFADINYVRAESPACCSMITTMIQDWPNFNLNDKAAYYLFSGIVSDTGRFRFRGVDSEVFANAAFLTKFKIDIPSMIEGMEVKKPEVLKLNGYVYNHFKTTPNGVAYIHFTKRMMNRFKVNKDDASNLVGLLGNIKGSLIWVAFIDQMLPHEMDPKYNMDKAKEIRVRFRSRQLAINGIAANYRGGGHEQAAGGIVYSKKEMKNALRDLDQLLAQYKKEHPDAY